MDLPQSSLAVLIVGIFTAIVIARSPGHHFHHGRTIFRKQEMPLIFQALETARGDVVCAMVAADS